MKGAKERRERWKEEQEMERRGVLLAHDCDGLVASVLLCACEVVHDTEQDGGIDTPLFWPLSYLVQYYDVGGDVLGGEGREGRGDGGEGREERGEEREGRGRKERGVIEGTYVDGI